MIEYSYCPTLAEEGDKDFYSNIAEQQNDLCNSSLKC